MKGLFIAFEGLDGSGKSTQIKAVSEYFKNKGIEVIVTREPGGTKVGEQIREILLNKDNEMDPVTESYLYAASRAQHVREVLRPAIEKGALVISDRYLFSSIAYQGFGRELGEQVVYNINKYAVDSLYPKLNVFFDLDLDKLKLSGEKDRLELNSSEFFKRVAGGFKSQYQNLNSFVVKADDSIEEVTKAIVKEIEGLLS